MEIQELNDLVRDEYDVIREKIDDTLLLLIDSSFYEFDEILLRPRLKKRPAKIKTPDGSHIWVNCDQDTNKRPYAYDLLFYGSKIAKLQIERETDEPFVYRVRVKPSILLEDDESLTALLGSQLEAAAFLNKFIGAIRDALGINPDGILTRKKKDQGRPPNKCDVIASRSFFEPGFFEKYLGKVFETNSEDEKYSVVYDWWFEKRGSGLKEPKRRWGQITSEGEGKKYFEKQQDRLINISPLDIFTSRHK